MSSSFSWGLTAAMFYLKGFSAKLGDEIRFLEDVENSACLLFLRDADFLHKGRFYNGRTPSPNSSSFLKLPRRVNAETAFIQAAGVGVGCVSPKSSLFYSFHFPENSVLKHRLLFFPHLFSYLQGTLASFLPIAQPLVVTQQSELFLAKCCNSFKTEFYGVTLHEVFKGFEGRHKEIRAHLTFPSSILASLVLSSLTFPCLTTYKK